MIHYRVLSLVLLGCVAVPNTVRAQGFIIPELGIRKNAMGAAIGRPDELAAIYHNPAALALLPGTQIQLSGGLVFLGTDIRLAPWKVDPKDANASYYMADRVESDGYYARQTPNVVAGIPMIGISTKLWSDKLAGALGIYVPNAAGADFGASAPSRYHIIDAYLFSAFFTLAVAYRPLPWLAVGLGASAVYIRVHRRSTLYPVVRDPKWPAVKDQDYGWALGKDAELTLEGEDVRPAFNLGIQVWPLKQLSLGFMVLSRYDVSLEGPLRLENGSGVLFKTDPTIADNQQRTEIVAPWVFGFGANYDITRWLEVGAEFRYYLTSQVEDQVTTITEGGLKALMPNGMVTPKNSHDSFHTGGGFNVKPPWHLPVELELMTGAYYESSSSPNNTVEVSAPSFNIVSYHVGGRVTIKKKYRVSLAYGHYWYLQRTTTDSITSPPTNFVGSGHSDMLTLVLDMHFGSGIGVK